MTTDTRERAYGDRVREARENMGLTQRQLGRLLTGRNTISAQQLVSRLENGYRVASARKAGWIGEQLRRVLGGEWADPPVLDRSGPRTRAKVPRVARVAVELDADQRARLEAYATARSLSLPAALREMAMGGAS